MEHYSIPYVHNTFNKYCELYPSVSYFKICFRKSYDTSDTTVISSTKTESLNLNIINASAAQRASSSPATTPGYTPENRLEVPKITEKRKWEEDGPANWFPYKKVKLHRDVVVFLFESVFGMIITKMRMDGLFNLKGYWDDTLSGIVYLSFFSWLCYWKLSVTNQRIVEASSHVMELTALKLLKEKSFSVQQNWLFKDQDPTIKYDCTYCIYYKEADSVHTTESIPNDVNVICALVRWRVLNFSWPQIESLFHASVLSFTY